LSGSFKTEFETPTELKYQVGGASSDPIVSDKSDFIKPKKNSFEQQKLGTGER